MMSRRYAVLILVGALVLASAGAVAAAAATPAEAPERVRGIRAVLPDLTAEQLEAIRGIEQAHFARSLELRTAMFTKQFELRQLRLALVPDESAIANKRAELQDLRKEMQELGREKREAVRAVLTDEQLARLQEFAGDRPGPRRPCRRINGRRARGF
jgi:Spy/CpxP family protein refolding chaperone